MRGKNANSSQLYNIPNKYKKSEIRLTADFGRLYLRVSMTCGPSLRFDAGSILPALFAVLLRGLRREERALTSL